MKTSCNCFEKGRGFHKKIAFKNKIETGIPNKKKIGEAHEFCSTNIKTVLQKYILNKLTVIQVY